MTPKQHYPKTLSSDDEGLCQQRRVPRRDSFTQSRPDPARDQQRLLDFAAVALAYLGYRLLRAEPGIGSHPHPIHDTDGLDDIVLPTKVVADAIDGSVASRVAQPASALPPIRTGPRLSTWTVARPARSCRSALVGVR
jgi:hypothetical protein